MCMMQTYSKKLLSQRHDYNEVSNLRFVPDRTARMAKEAFTMTMTMLENVNRMASTMMATLSARNTPITSKQQPPSDLRITRLYIRDLRSNALDGIEQLTELLEVIQAMDRDVEQSVVAHHEGKDRARRARQRGRGHGRGRGRAGRLLQDDNDDSDDTAASAVRIVNGVGRGPPPPPSGGSSDSAKRIRV